MSGGGGGGDGGGGGRDSRLQYIPQCSVSCRIARFDL